MTTIIAFFIVLAVLVLAHEFGHFITAKMSGVKVEEFGLGFPPRLASFKKGETVYSINAIPLGGFTKMAGEEDANIKRSLASKGVWPRLLILSAGSLMNLLLPLVLFSVAFMVPHQAVTEPVIIAEVMQSSPAASAGIQPGDQITRIAGKTIQNSGDVHRAVYLNFGKPMTMELKRGSDTFKVDVIPRWKPPAGEGAVGIRFDIEAANAGRVVSKASEPFWKAIPMGITECGETLVLFKNSIISMIVGTTPVAVTGPVGVAQITGEAAKAGMSPLLEFTGFFSINLAIINLLPLPALDGGRIVFVILEAIRRGKRISAKTEGLIHTIGFAMLISLMIFVTYQDIFRIISGG